MSRRPLLLFACCLLLSGCGVSPLRTPPHKPVYSGEHFSEDETFSRLFDASASDACEAARRALLSQGYVISKFSDGMVQGSKDFQPGGDEHVEIAFHVVCVGEGNKKGVSTAYVSAQQERYALKKSAQSASLGVSALGSISVPLSSTDDSLVKVASETIPAGAFYDRFFTLMQRLLRESADDH